MTSPGPVYFFDQPTRQRRRNGVRGSSLNLYGTSQEDAENKDQSDGPRGLPSEAYEEDDTSSTVFHIKELDVVDAYRRTAPRLLSNLAQILSQHKWSDGGRVPHGLVNILNYTWQELTAGARLLTQHTDKPCMSLGPLNQDLSPRPLSANQKREREVAPCQAKPQVSFNPSVKKRKSRSSKDLSTASLSFSILNQSSTDPGWIIHHQDTTSNEDISSYKWALEQLQGARIPLKIQTLEQDLNRSLILRHYGEAQSKLKDRSEKRKARPATLVNGLPQIPEVKQLDPHRQKLHYRINDGSSFIYYPSGCMAVCQSYSGLPCGGFYTSVFSDSGRPMIVATITTFGHGAVMHPRSSAISAVWDQEGGLIFDHKGTITKEWSWHTECTKKRIVMQVSDEISLELFNGTSAMLTFSSDNETVHLPLSALSNINPAHKMQCLQSNITFTSDTAQELLLANSSPLCIDDMNLTQTHEVHQRVKEVERLEEASALWRREGRSGRELRRIQQRVQSTLGAWMDYYCVAIGIKCPDMKRMPDVPPRSRLKREVHLATLPSLNSPERAYAGPVQPQDSSNELPRHLSAQPQRHQDSALKLSSPVKKRTKKECPVTRIGPLQFYGSINLESVILPQDPDQQACVAYPAHFSFTPSAPLTLCPVLLRAALLGEGPRRRCCCSASLMPLVTDLEYDTFIMGQPPHTQQMLIVCVTCQKQYPQTAPGKDPLEQLYRSRNKHRTMPCTQCQMDSFRLVKYEISTPKPCFEAQKVLLQQRHNAAPGMVLMYIKGKLLFAGYITSSNHCCPIKDLQKQISRARGDYRLGLSLPSDFKFSDTVDTAAATDNSQDTLRREDTRKTSCLLKTVQ